VLLGLLASGASAQQDPRPRVEDDPAYQAWMNDPNATGPFTFDSEEFASSEPTYHTGYVELADGAVAIELPEGMLLLQRDDAREVVESRWGNPAGLPVQALVVPGEGVVDEGTWGVVVAFEEDGHVDDGGAEELLDAEELLAVLRERAGAENELRAEDGLPAVEVVGWARPPMYDAARKRLAWAREVRFEGVPVSVLNYDVRLLGRTGVLILSVVSTMDDLEAVDAALPRLVDATTFTAGNTYAEFEPGGDPVAPYGLRDLVAGADPGGGLLGRLLGRLTPLEVLALAVVFAVIVGRLIPAKGRKKTA
jgi:uncharacterized membrane-anchored protein